MARKSLYGKFILSAGEIGSYTVCPEAWRLTSMRSKKNSASKNSKVGEELHRTWASDNDEVIFLTKGAKLVIFLIILTLLITQVI